MPENQLDCNNSQIHSFIRIRHENGSTTTSKRHKQRITCCDIPIHSFEFVYVVMWDRGYRWTLWELGSMSRSATETENPYLRNRYHIRMGPHERTLRPPLIRQSCSSFLLAISSNLQESYATIIVIPFNPKSILKLVYGSRFFFYQIQFLGDLQPSLNYRFAHLSVGVCIIFMQPQALDGMFFIVWLHNEFIIKLYFIRVYTTPIPMSDVCLLFVCVFNVYMRW